MTKRCNKPFIKHQMIFLDIPIFFFLIGKEDITGYFKCRNCDHKMIGCLEFKLEEVT